MRFSEYLPWLAATFASLIFVNAIVSARWPDKTKIAFKAFVAVLFFFAIGAYWLSTGEKIDETVYKSVLCKLHSFERCSSAPIEQNRSAPIEQTRSAPIEQTRKEQQATKTILPPPSLKVHTTVTVRTDGIYRNTVRETQRTYYEFVRFYGDGTVIAANTPSSGVTEQWFSKESPLGFPKGRYKIDGDKISFSATNTYGTIDYEGSLANEILSLDSHSQINGGTFSGQYFFIPF